MVAGDLVERGYKMAIPFGEDSDVDLVCWNPDGRLERVQVKYTGSDGARVSVGANSNSLTKGRVRRIKRYTDATIDWLAVFDATTGRFYYIFVDELGGGPNQLTSAHPHGQQPAWADQLRRGLPGPINRQAHLEP